MIDSGELTRVHLLISGRVQGVFFRATMARDARSRGLTGWIRNTRDGRVETEAQGRRRDVDHFVDECRAGPPLATVSDIELQHIDPVDGEDRFRVVV